MSYLAFWLVGGGMAEVLHAIIYATKLLLRKMSSQYLSSWSEIWNGYRIQNYPESYELGLGLEILRLGHAFDISGGSLGIS